MLLILFRANSGGRIAYNIAVSAWHSIPGDDGQGWRQKQRWGVEKGRERRWDQGQAAMEHTDEVTYVKKMIWDFLH